MLRLCVIDNGRIGLWNTCGHVYTARPKANNLSCSHKMLPSFLSYAECQVHNQVKCTQGDFYAHLKHHLWQATCPQPVPWAPGGCPEPSRALPASIFKSIILFQQDCQLQRQLLLFFMYLLSCCSFSMKVRTVNLHLIEGKRGRSHLLGKCRFIHPPGDGVQTECCLMWYAL